MESNGGSVSPTDSQARTMLRPLLPALSPDPAQDAPLLKGLIRRTGIPARAACHACRRRKSRCSGGRPKCSSCQARGVDCVYDTASKAETRVQALKRKCTELNEQQSSYQRVYELLRTRPLSEVSHVLTRIREGADPDSILRLIDDGDLLLQLNLTPETRYRYEFPYRREMPISVMQVDNPYLSSLVYECSLRNPSAHEPLETIDVAFEEYRDLYLKPLHAAKIVDPLLEAAEPSKWTNITKDDDLLRKLLAVYFINEYQTLTAFNKDYFLQDMAAGRHRFCSRLLLHAIMSMACLCYKEFPKRYEYWNPQSLAYQFLSEAKRLWELESHKQKLTTIQAGLLLNVAHNMCCQDKLGWSYTMQSVTMAQSMGLFSPSSKPMSQRERDARDFTAWAVFQFQALHCFLLFDKPLMLRPPDIPLPDPVTSAYWYSEVWLKYPTRDRLCPVNFPQLFRARAEVRAIMNEILLQSFGDQSKPRQITVEQARIFCYRLETWYNQLPRAINAKKAVLPSHLLLHMNYQTMLINIHSSFQNQGPFFDGYDPHSARETAFRKLETLIRLYYLRHGFEVADPLSIQPLSLMAFENFGKLVQNPNGPDSESVRSSMILAAKGLWDQGQNFYVARTTLCLLRQRMQDAASASELRVLDDEVRIKVEPESMHQTQIREVRSRWPPSITAITDDPEGQRLYHLVQQYMTMHIDSDEDDVESVDDELYGTDTNMNDYRGSPATTNGSSQVHSPS